MALITRIAGREALLIMSRAPISMGRTLLAAESIHEMTLRSFSAFIRPGVSLSRCTRMERLIVGRLEQIYGLIRGAGILSISVRYAAAIDAMKQMQAMAQAASAAAAMESVLPMGANHV